jgi:hypothetical protein
MPRDANASRIALMMVCAAALRAACLGHELSPGGVVGSQWLNRESKDGFTMARLHTENDCCGYGLPTFADSAAKG